MTKAEITLGQRVLITGDHPWRDHAGTVIGFDSFVGVSETAAVIHLDSGDQAWVFHPENLEAVAE